MADLCDEHEVKPSVVYSWQNQPFSNIEVALDTGRQRSNANSKQTAHEREIAALKAKLAKKDAVIAEVTEELVGLKKELGGQPKRGFRFFISTMAATRSADGPRGPGLPGCLAEKRRRYLALEFGC